MRLVWLASALVVLATSAISAVNAQEVEAEDNTLSAMVVLDRSNSMADEAGARTKFEAAQDSVIGLVQNAPDGANIGLHVFPAVGSRCGPGSTVRPVGGLTAANVTSVVAGFDATGDGTPIGEALEAAASTLPTSGVRVVILVSDGEANCGGDPCEVAASIVDRGIEVQVHSVGIQIGDRGRGQLTCVSEVTGGTYTDIDDLDDLEDLLLDLVEVDATLEVHAPAEVFSNADLSLNDPVDITATVGSLGPGPLRDAVVTIEFTGNQLVAVFTPVVEIGNVDEASERTVRWAFSPPSSVNTYVVAYTVTVSSINGPSISESGSIDIRGRELTLDNAGPVLSEASQVVIMGDSYSSGEGAGDYFDWTDKEWNHCHRTFNTYGKALWQERIIIACSGAITDDVLNPASNALLEQGGDPVWSQREQLSMVDDPAPDLVLLTLGGNDIEFGLLIGKCFVPNADSCKTGFVRSVCLGWFEWLTCDGGEYNDMTGEEVVELLLPPLNERLEEIYRVIDYQVNSAVGEREVPTQIVVLAYVNPFPANIDDRGWCGAWNPANLTENMSEDEMRWGESVLEDLNVEVAQAVLQMQAEGRPFHMAYSVVDAVQPNNITGEPGHTICDDVTWINVASTKDAAGAGTRIEAIHPNSDGYRAVTEKLMLDSQAWQVRSRAEQPVPEVSCVEVPSEGVTVIDMSADVIVVDIGECYEVALSGLEPESSAALLLQSDPVWLATARLDADGGAAVRFRIPSDAPPGAHMLSVVFETSEGGFARYSVPIELSGPPFWQENVVDVALAMMAVLLAGGLVLLRLGRPVVPETVSRSEDDS